MGTELGGDVWEKCMLMCNAIMIGLSATVSNGEEIHNWWTRIERRRSELYMKPERQVKIIQYKERLADLNKYLYSGKELYPIHPIGIMNSKQLVERGNLPVDLSLSPKETLQLHDAIQTTLHDTIISDKK
jgi:superfamily II RNA helicase